MVYTRSGVNAATRASGSSRGSGSRTPEPALRRSHRYTNSGSKKSLYRDSSSSEDDDSDSSGTDSDDADSSTDGDKDGFAWLKSRNAARCQVGGDWYVESDSTGGSIFKSFPIEVHQNIISKLPTDCDIAIYARLSRATLDAVSPSVWRARFEKTFDLIDGLKTKTIAERYKRRKAFFKTWIIFDLKKLNAVVGKDVREKQWYYQEECITRLLDMILASNAYKSSDGSGTVIARNLSFLRLLTCEQRAHEVGTYLDILDALFEADYTQQPRGEYTDATKATEIKVIQLCLSSIILDPNFCKTNVSHFDTSQQYVYGTELKTPLFPGKYKQEFNINVLLHTVNFFKYHLKSGVGEGLLCDQYNQLTSNQLPQFWLGKIKSGTQELGSHWKGAYTWMKPQQLNKLRTEGSDGNIFSDEADDEHGIHDLTLFFNDPAFPKRDWPSGFDLILNSDPYAEFRDLEAVKRMTPRKRAFGANKPPFMQFSGSSRGQKDGHMFGRVHAINTQGDVHGWQRVSMMKFFTNEAGTYDPTQVWAYEGVVLPGGRMIIGRWREARPNSDEPNWINSGPFIFWNVDDNQVEPPIRMDEALEFAKSIDDPMLTGFNI